MVFKRKTKLNQKAEIMYDKITERLGEHNAEANYENNDYYEQYVWKGETGHGNEIINLAVWGCGLVRAVLKKQIGGAEWEIFNSNKLEDVDDAIEIFLYFKNYKSAKSE